MKPHTIRMLEERSRRLDHLEYLVRCLSNYIGEEKSATLIELREANTIALATRLGIRTELVEDCRYRTANGMCSNADSDRRFWPCDGPCRYWEGQPQ